MNILLDSHILLWTLAGSRQIPMKARDLIVDESNQIYFSSASLWELSIKHQLHADVIPFSTEELLEFCGEAEFKELPVTSAHVRMLATLSRSETAPRHKDPFDRILIAQAKAEDMKFLTHDAMLP